jgi:hypothetical protein
MGLIDGDESRRLGIYKENMNQAKAEDVFHMCKRVLGILTETPQGRKRRIEQITWLSCLRVMAPAKKKRHAIT